MSPMSEISSTITSTSTTAQRRKIKKPLIEKRRRLRINQCLANLKSLVLEATNKDENCFPKMEKADILEMTVAYMKTMKHRTTVPGSGSVDSVEHGRTYLSGFRECAMQVCSFLVDDSASVTGGVELRSQLTRHLNGCFERIQTDLQRHADVQPGCPNLESGKTISEGRASSSLSSSTRHSSNSSPVSLSPQSKAEMPKIINASSSAVPLTSRFSDPHGNSITNQLQSNTFPSSSITSTSVIRSLHSSNFPSPINSSASQCHPDTCVSPKKGDEFPSMSMTPPNLFTIGQNHFASSSYSREPVPVRNFYSSSTVWRPW